MKRYAFLVGYLIFFGCETSHYPDFDVAQKMFQDFDAILSPQDYAQTYYYHMSQDSLWMDKNNKPATIDIPYQNHFFGFSQDFLSTQQGGTGVNTRLIKRYNSGRVSHRIYELEKLQFEGKTLIHPIYILTFGNSKKVEQARLFSSDGILLKESIKNFLGE